MSILQWQKWTPLSSRDMFSESHFIVIVHLGRHVSWLDGLLSSLTHRLANCGDTRQKVCTPSRRGGHRPHDLLEGLLLSLRQVTCLESDEVFTARLRVMRPKSCISGRNHWLVVFEHFISHPMWDDYIKA